MSACVSLLPEVHGDLVPCKCLPSFSPQWSLLCWPVALRTSLPHAWLPWGDLCMRVCHRRVPCSLSLPDPALTPVTLMEIWSYCHFWHLLSGAVGWLTDQTKCSEGKGLSLKACFCRGEGSRMFSNCFPWFAFSWTTHCQAYRRSQPSEDWKAFPGGFWLTVMLVLGEGGCSWQIAFCFVFVGSHTLPSYSFAYLWDTDSEWQLIVIIFPQLTATIAVLSVFWGGLSVSLAVSSSVQWSLSVKLVSS